MSSISGASQTAGTKAFSENKKKNKNFILKKIAKKRIFVNLNKMIYLLIFQLKKRLNIDGIEGARKDAKPLPYSSPGYQWVHVDFLLCK